MEVASPSILQRIVKESLAAFPDDAHFRVLQFFEGKGVGEDSKNLIKGAWSKAVLSSDAFGRGKKRSANTDSFSYDFIAELTRHFSDTSALDRISKTFEQAETELSAMDLRDGLTEHQQKSMSAIIDSLDASQNLIKSYVRNIFALPADFLALTETHESGHLDALVQYQEVMRRLKPVWKRQDRISFHVHPISEELLFEHSYRLGKLTLGMDDVVDPPLFFSSVDALGLEVPHDHSSASDACWSTFGFLHDFICCRYLNIFPKPISVQRLEENFATIFVFEAPTCRLLQPLLGSELAVLLRKHPAVAMLWATQLSLAIQAMSFSVAQLATAISLAKNVYVRDDGMLLIGGVSFCETVAVGASGVLSHQCATFFVPLAYQILSTALCLSRTESSVLPKVSNFQHAGLVFRRPEEVFSSDPSSRGVEHVVATGSQLAMKLYCGSVADAVILSFEQAYGEGYRSAELDSYLNVLVIVTDWQPARPTDPNSANPTAPSVTAKVVTNPLADNSSSGSGSGSGSGVFVLVNVANASPGRLVIECTALVPDVCNLSSAERRWGNFAVDFVDMPPAEAVEVQELAGYIEERHTWAIDTAVLNSYLFHGARDLLFDDARSRDLVMRGARDWSSIKRSLAHKRALVEPSDS